MMRNKKIIVIFCLIGLLACPFLSQGVSIAFYETNPDFNPNYIISDTAVMDYNSLTIEQIRDFIVGQGGALGSYIDPQANLPSYYVIWQTAQEFHINPKFILTMLQKEQSLVTDPAPSKNQYDWAVGYSCYGGICLDKYRGFSTQIQAMANKFINDYFADLNVRSKYKNNFFCTFTKWCIGDAKETQDYQLIIPQNKATAALYTYNPYRGGTLVDDQRIGANYNFWKIWESWFEQEVFRPTGTLLKAAGSDDVYLIQNGQKRRFANFSSLVTRYDPTDIVLVEGAELDQYASGPEIKFPQYSLLANSQGDIFLLVDDSLRHIASMEVFRTLGLNPEEVEEAADQDLASLKQGPEITLSSAYPTGALIKDVTSGGVYFVQNGIKYPIFSKEILQVNYPSQKVLSGHPEELDKYPKGEAVKFKDGTLIKSDSSDVVYFISGGKKLPVASEKAFLSRNYSWVKIVVTAQAAVDIHPTGETLDILDVSLIPKAKTPAATGTENLTNDVGQFGEVGSLGDNPTTTTTNY